MMHRSALIRNQSPPGGQANMASDGDDQVNEDYSDHSIGIEVGTPRGQIGIEAHDCWLESVEPDSEKEEWQQSLEEQDGDMVGK